MTGNTLAQVIFLSHFSTFVVSVTDCEILLLGVFALEGPDNCLSYGTSSKTERRSPIINLANK